MIKRSVVFNSTVVISCKTRVLTNGKSVMCAWFPRGRQQSAARENQQARTAPLANVRGTATRSDVMTDDALRCQGEPWTIYKAQCADERRTGVTLEGLNRLSLTWRCQENVYTFNSVLRADAQKYQVYQCWRILREVLESSADHAFR